MDSFPFYINTLINSAKFIKAFINNGYLCYAAFNESMVRALKLPRIPIFYKFLKLPEEDMEEKKYLSSRTRTSISMGTRKGSSDTSSKSLLFLLF
jgi:hypothetical protein